MKLDDILYEDPDQVMYQLFDRRTKKPMGKPSANRKRLQTRADKLDNEWGAYRYHVDRITPYSEGANPLSNQHDLRKKATGLINRANQILAQQKGSNPSPHEVVALIKQKANPTREVLAAIHSLLRLP